MLFVIHAIDREGDGSPRANNREAHLGFLSEAGDAVKLAGPLLTAHVMLRDEVSDPLIERVVTQFLAAVPVAPQSNERRVED